MRSPTLSPLKTRERAVLEIDLVAYSDVALMLEENLSVEAVKVFEDQVQSFVDHGLDTVGLQREDIVLGTAGDNAILIFDDAETMHRFAQAVQSETLVYNGTKSFESAKDGSEWAPRLVLSWLSLWDGESLDQQSPVLYGSKPPQKKVNLWLIGRHLKRSRTI